METKIVHQLYTLTVTECPKDKAIIVNISDPKMGIFMMLNQSEAMAVVNAITDAFNLEPYV